MQTQTKTDGKTSQESLCGHPAPKGQWCDGCARDLEHGNYESLPLKLQKHFIKQELNKLESLDCSNITREDGTLDVREFNLLPEVRKIVKHIKSFGWNRTKLREHFQIAGLLLAFEIKESK